MELLKLNSIIKDDKIVLNFVDNSVIEINTTADIELTGLVEHLTVMLANGNNIEAQFEETENPKLEIVFETIKGILDSYNSSVDNYREEKKSLESEV